MTSKLFILILGIILLTGSVSALEFDNVKNYNEETKTVTITNAFGLGDKIAEVTLLTPQHNLVFPGRNTLIAKFKLKLYESYDYPFKKIEFYNYESFKLPEKEFHYKYLTEVIEEVNDTIRNCVILKNESESCNTIILDSTTQKTKSIWKNFNKRSNFQPGTYEIGIFMNNMFEERIEWIPTFFGVEIEEWADFTFLSYNNVNFSIVAESSDTDGIFFKPDGTRMYIIDPTTDKVYQYALTTPWNLSTAVHRNIEKSVNSEDTTPNGVSFSSDGTKMYILGYIGKDVNQYTLTTPWNVSTASFDTVSFSTTNQDTESQSILFNDNGTRMYMVGATTGGIYEYSLTAWDLSTASYSNKNFNFTTWGKNTQDAQFNANGSKLIVVNTVNNSLYQYSLSTPYDISTLSNDLDTFNLTDQESDPQALFWGKNNEKIYIVGTSEDRVFEYLFSGPVITLNFPEDNLETLSANVTLNCSIVDSLNLTMMINGVQNITITNSTPNANLSLQTNYNYSLGQHNWSCSGSNGGIHQYSLTRNFISGFIINSEIFNTSTLETSSETFFINISTGETETETTSAFFFYEGINKGLANKTVSSNSTIFSKTIDIPILDSGTSNNNSFYWNIQIFNGSNSFETNVEANGQVSSRIYLEKCNVTFPTKSLNFTAFNEENLTRINPFRFDGSFEIWLGSGSEKRINSFSNSSAEEVNLCISPNKTYFTDAQIEYNEPLNISFVTRNYFLQNSLIDNTIQHIPLYLLNSTKSTTFILQVQDDNLLPLVDYVILIQRYYPGEGVFRTVQIAKTDDEGKTVGFFEAETVDYRFIIQKDGETLLVTNQQKIVGTSIPFTITFTIGGDLGVPWSDLEELDLLTQTLIFNNTNNVVTFTYSDLSGNFSSGRLFVEKQNISGLQNEVICNINTVQSSAILLCDVGNITTNDTGTYTAIGLITRSGEDEEIINSINFQITTMASIAGLLGVLLGWFVILISAFAFKFNEIAGIFMINITVIFVNIIGLVDFGILAISALIAVSIIIGSVLER